MTFNVAPVAHKKKNETAKNIMKLKALWLNYFAWCVLKKFVHLFALFFSYSKFIPV